MYLFSEQLRYTCERDLENPQERAGEPAHRLCRAFTNNLRSHNTRFRAQPSTEISLDLNPNLRSQNKSTNSYVDARELADGQIESLEFVQIDDERIVLGLSDVLEHLSNNWIVTIELDGTHSFTARPKLENGSLFLYIAPQT